MRILLYILLLVIPAALLRAQEPKALQSASYYDSLIRNGDSCNIYNHVFLANIYRKEKKTYELKKTLERAIKCPLKDFTQRGFYLELADIYLEEGNFWNTLALITLYDTTENKVDRPHDAYQYVTNFTLALKRSKCYIGLHFTDSALQVLSPYMFYKHDYWKGFYDSLSYNNVLLNYLTLLQKKFSNKDVKAALEKANSSFYYYDSTDNKSNEFGLIHHKIGCGFQFFMYPVKYLEIETWNSQGNISYHSFSKDYQYSYFKETPLIKESKCYRKRFG